MKAQHQLNVILIAFLSTLLFISLFIFGLKQFSQLVNPYNIVKLSILFLIIIPFFVLFSVRWVIWKGVEEKIQNNSRWLSILLCFFIPVLMVVPFIGSDFIHLTCPYVFTEHKKLLILLGFIISIIVVYDARFFKKQINFHKIGIWLILIAAIIFQTVSFRVVNTNLMANNIIWYNFDAVYYPLSQVVMGKTLLVDLPSQYGLYPELLSPIFKLIGLNVLSFTVVMGILQCAALLLLTLFLFKTIKNFYLIVIYILSACVLTGFTYLSFIDQATWLIYFQYWPIRFIFPVLGIFCFSRFAKNSSIINLLIMSVVGAVAALWNLDTGIPVLGAFWAYLCMRLIFTREISRKIRMLHLIISCVTAIVLWTMFFLYLALKSGQSIHFYDLIEYQEIMAIGAFGGRVLIPMRYHPWMIFYTVYIFGLVASLYAWFKNSKSPFWDIVFYLSILGLGLFTYYQFRSVIDNLVMISWLPVLTAFVLSDRLLRLIKAKKVPSKYRLLTIPIIFFGALLLMNFVFGIPKLLDKGKTDWAVIMHPGSAPISENIAFIKSHARKTEKTAILAKNQGIYFAETGLVSALEGPDFSQALSPSDHTNMMNQLLKLPIDNLFIGADEPHISPAEFKILLGRFYIEAESKAGMFYLKRKNERTKHD